MFVHATGTTGSKDVIEQLRNRVQSPYPVASLEAVQAAEANLGFELPELLRSLYLRVGNGGYGPSGMRLLGVEGGYKYFGKHTLDSRHIALHRNGGSPFFKYVKDGEVISTWPYHLVQIFTSTTHVEVYVDCNSNSLPMYFFDAQMSSVVRFGVPVPIFNSNYLLLQWLQEWVDGTDLYYRLERYTEQQIESYLSDVGLGAASPLQ